MNQADTETDEVYAQMTLQPVNKVGQPFINKWVLYIYMCMCLKYYVLCGSMTGMHYWHLIWASNKTDNPPSFSAKLSRRATRVHMVDFPYPAVQRRRYSHLWCDNQLPISGLFVLLPLLVVADVEVETNEMCVQDFSMQPPAQELSARDLHDNSWTFRHIYRGNFFFFLSD